MKYSKPTIQTTGACVSIQSGSNKPSTLLMDGTVKIETPLAYEADE